MKFVYLIKLMLYMEEFNEASKIYEQLIDKNNDNIDLKFGLGICFYKLKDYDKAIQQFDLILVKEPDNFDALSIVKTNFKKMIPFVHSVGPYCGERNTNDYIEEDSIRWELSSYSNKNELNNYLKSFMTDRVISKYTNSNYTLDLYKEKNGKLYCLRK